MMWIDDHNPREEEIMRAIRQYVEDFRCDSWNDGYDEGHREAENSVWDEARNKGYDEGWEDAVQYILDTTVQNNGLVMTPKNREELEEALEMFKDNGPMCVMLTLNLLNTEIADMKVR